MRKVSVILGILCLAFSTAAFASDNNGSYYFGSDSVAGDGVSSSDTGAWNVTTPEFVGGVPSSGTLDIQFLNNSNETDFNSNIGVAFYVDWSHTLITPTEIMGSSLMPVFSGVFAANTIVPGFMGVGTDSATWNIAWNILPENGPEGTVAGIWVVEGLGPSDAAWSGSRLIASNYFGENDVEAMEIFSIHQGAAPLVVPEPATMLLLGSGLCGLAGMKFRRKKA